MRRVLSLVLSSLSDVYLLLLFSPFMQSLNCWFVLVFVHHVKCFLFNVLVLYFAGFLEGEHFGCGFVEKLLSLVLRARCCFCCRYVRS